MGDDEDGEEQRELIWCDRPVFSHGKTEEVGHVLDVGMMEHIPQPDEKEEEKESHSEDVASHVAVEDESPVVSGLVVHHLLCGGQSRECERCERVHDEVDPEHLRDGEGRLQAHERACEHEQACRNVDRELEKQESLDVDEQRPSPLHRLDDAGERVVEDGDVACLFGHVGSRSHGESDVSRVESRRVVGSVAGDGDDMSSLLQRLHEALLVHGSRTCDNPDVVGPAEQFLVRQLGEFRALDGVAFAAGVVPYANLACNLTRRGRGVACDDLHLYARRQAFANRMLHVVAYGVLDSDNPHENEVVGHEFSVTDGLTAVVHHLAGECQRAHGLVLIFHESLFIFFP